MFTIRLDFKMLSQKQLDYASDQLGIQFVINMRKINVLISKLKRAQTGGRPSELFYSVSTPRHLL